MPEDMDLLTKYSNSGQVESREYVGVPVSKQVYNQSSDQQVSE